MSPGPAITDLCDRETFGVKPEVFLLSERNRDA